MNSPFFVKQIISYRIVLINRAILLFLDFQLKKARFCVLFCNFYFVTSIVTVSGIVHKFLKFFQKPLDKLV